ncbi:hypothetical protein BH09BAC2_BH09BAC2_19590 [soil metagenome]
MNYNNLYKKIEQYVTGLFHTMHNDTLVFHNLKHTQQVVERTKEIAGHYNVDEEGMLVLFAAAWFHDTGHLFTEPSKHEVMSAEVMKKYMVEQGATPEVISQIEKCIMATKAPRNPKQLFEEIICDADTYHLGTQDFKKTNKRALEEEQLRDGITNKTAFNESTLNMLERHTFYTGYCKELLNATKALNMKKMKNKIEKQKAEKNEPEENSWDGGKEESLADMEKDKTGLMSKGIQTMLRLTSENHLKLSDMADHKANILISVNSIIISVILSVLLRKLPDAPYLTIPSIIFLAVAVATIVISILATRPKINEGTFSHEDILNKKTNLLFFGNFYKASFEQYNSGMRSMMKDTDYLYGSLIKDIYYLGAVLGRKYKLIRLAYNIFMIGIIISVFAFAIAAFFNNGTPVETTVNPGGGSPL